MNVKSVFMFPAFSATTQIILGQPPTLSTNMEEELSDFQRMLGQLNTLKDEKQLPVMDFLPKKMSMEEMRTTLSTMDVDTLAVVLKNLRPSEELLASKHDLLLLEEMSEKLLEVQATDEDSAAPFIEISSDLLVIEIMTSYNNMELRRNIEKGAMLENNLTVIPPFLYEPKEIQVHESVIDWTEMQQQAKQIVVQAENLLAQVNSPQDIARIAPKILKILEEWHQLTIKTVNNPELASILKMENKQTSTIWQNLVQSFQNRAGVSQRLHYNLDAKVTTTDIIRWLGKAMEGHVQHEKLTIQTEKITPQLEKVPPLSTTTVTAIPMSKVEQYVIHLNQTQNNIPANKQFVEQFQKIMDASKLSHLQTGRGQLSIHLKPTNLGEMMVRFTQINGEMVVKILVTTAVAKEMLEGNLQQLRNMFAPQQVLIEKQEVIAQENRKSQEHQSSDQQNERREDRTEPESDRNLADEETFSDLFQELILNEKV